MSKHNKWPEIAAQIIYEAYPDCDVLPIEPPRPGESIREFKARAEDAGDTLFLFLCREADDEINAQVYIARLERAIRDVQSVKDAFRESLAARSSAAATAGRKETIRLRLDADWIELTLTDAGAQGRRAGSVASTLHTSEQDGAKFNAAMDAVESLVLAHACAGLDVTEPRYLAGIRTCIDACVNHLPGSEA